jgi:hypothetical protein
MVFALPTRLFLPALLGLWGFRCAAQGQEAVTVGLPTAVLLREESVLRQGVARRAPGEADTTFLKRVFPASFPLADDLVAYAWHPTPFGKQLFFSYQGRSDPEDAPMLYVLDPFQANTYAVQELPLSIVGDGTVLTAPFFIDVDQDGQKELLTLQEGSNSETRKGADGEWRRAHYRRYQTLVYQFGGFDEAGRPQYRLDQTPRPYLDDLPTAADVRRALTRHSIRPKHTRKA